jgi:hypothetical protein
MKLFRCVSFPESRHWVISHVTIIDDDNFFQLVLRIPRKNFFRTLQKSFCQKKHCDTEIGDFEECCKNAKLNVIQTNVPLLFSSCFWWSALMARSVLQRWSFNIFWIT